jgi:O-antigen ligase
MKRVFNWAFVLFVFSIPFVPIELNVKFLILVTVLSFFAYPFHLKKLLILSWDTALYLGVLIFGLLYSANVNAGLSVLETNFSFVAIAIIGSHYKNLSQHRLNIIFFWFLAGVLIACLLCLGNAIVKYTVSGDTDVFFFYNFTSFIDSHPTYLAYYVIFSITFVLHWLNDNKDRFTPGYIFFVLLLIAFLFFVLALTGGLTAFTSLLLVCSFFLLQFFLEERASKRMLTASIAGFMVVGMFIISSLNHASAKQVLKDDSWDRLQLWSAAMHANNDLFLGVGTGDYKAVLNEYYATHGLEEYARENYNSHNQFIQIFFSNGFLGLVAILFLVGRPLYLAIRNNNAFGILVFFPFLIYGMTEVFLGRYQGVVFFALLHQAFVSYYYNYKPTIRFKEQRSI